MPRMIDVCSILLTLVVDLLVVITLFVITLAACEPKWHLLSRAKEWVDDELERCEIEEMIVKRDRGLKDYAELTEDYINLQDCFEEASGQIATANMRLRGVLGGTKLDPEHVSLEEFRAYWKSLKGK